MPPKRRKQPARISAKSAKQDKPALAQGPSVTTRRARSTKPKVSTVSRGRNISSTAVRERDHSPESADEQDIVHADCIDENLQMMVQQQDVEQQEGCDSDSSSEDGEISLGRASPSSSNNNATVSSSEDERNQDRSGEATDAEFNGGQSPRQRSRAHSSRSRNPRSNQGDDYAAAIQKIIQKRGFVDPKDLAKLNKRYHQGDSGEEDPPAPRKRGRYDAPEGPKRNVGGGDRERGRVSFSNQVVQNDSTSDVTIYSNAVKNRFPNKRFSSSSEDAEFNISDEQEGLDRIDSNSRQFIAEIRKHYQGNQRGESSGHSREIVDRRPSGSGVRYSRRDCDESPHVERYRRDVSRDVSPEGRAEQMVREAEANKAKVYNTPGKDPELAINDDSPFIHSAIADESYMLVATHLDEAIIKRIEQDEYVDFAKLLARDKMLDNEETEMRLVQRDGRTMYVPVKDECLINNVLKWDQAFRVYSNIYTRVFPNKATQLVQYSHIIHSAAQSYAWSNVYQYDKDFRDHMSRNKGRSWGIILQQAWTMRLRDRLSLHNNNYEGNRFSPKGNSRDNQKSTKEPCRRFNRGKCSYGTSCIFEHRCNYCFKFGHPIVNCRKMIADQGNNNKTPTRNDAVSQPTPPATKK